jgi:hypothetical protein
MNRWQNTDDRVRFSIKAEGSPEHCGIATQPRLPEAMRNDCDELFAGRKGPPNCHRHACHLEEVLRNSRDEQPLRDVAVPPVRLLQVERTRQRCKDS